MKEPLKLWLGLFFLNFLPKKCSSVFVDTLNVVNVSTIEIFDTQVENIVSIPCYTEY